MDTTLQDLIKRMGVDPGFFQEGGSKLFGQTIGLAGKGLEGFQKFADISKFDPAAIEEMLKSIGQYGQKQTGYVQEKFKSGQGTLRDMLTDSMRQLREGSSVRGGQFGAMQKAIGQSRQKAGTAFGQLGQQFQQGMDTVGQQVDARTAQVQGLLGDYISRLTGLGSQYLSFDPGTGSQTGYEGYTPSTTGDPGGIDTTAPIAGDPNQAYV
jgi:hypothetical protein|tara:strand:- start:1012 stop:1641 length:630 start_codon:yes stop_codon:yes gene_type:complete